MKNVPSRHDLINLRGVKLEAEELIGHALQKFLVDLQGVGLAPETKLTLVVAVTTLQGEEQGRLQLVLADLQIEATLSGPGPTDNFGWELRI